MLHLLLSCNSVLFLTLCFLCLILRDLRLDLFFHLLFLSLFFSYSIIFTTPFISQVLLKSSHLPVNAVPDSGVVFALSVPPFVSAPHISLMFRKSFLFCLLELKPSLLNFEVFSSLAGIKLAFWLSQNIGSE